MSYKRKAKKGIPKNTNHCFGCKNLIKIKQGNNLVKRCNYLKVNGFDESVTEFLSNINPNAYTTEELDKLISDTELSFELYYCNKICGLYLNKKKEEKFIPPYEGYNSEDDIPF